MNSAPANQKRLVYFPFNKKENKANERSVRCYALSMLEEGRQSTKESPNDEEIVDNDAGMASPTNLQTLQTLT